MLASIEQSTPGRAFNLPRSSASRERTAWRSASPQSASLAALAGEGLGGRFRSWRGASGRRFMFSVYSSAACPAYDHAVLIGAGVAADGERHVLFIADTGAFPEPVLERARAMLARADQRTELHVHVLAQSPGERAALIEDLSAPCANSSGVGSDFLFASQRRGR